MPAPGSLYGEGAQLLDSAGTQAGNIAKQRQAATDTTVQAGNDAGKELGADRRQESSQQAAMALEKLKASEKLVQITPQMALGLAKNTGDKEWLSAIGQEIRPDTLMGLYTHGMALQQAKKAPKITQIYDKSGKVRHAVVYTDEEGNIQEHMLDEGIAPDKLHPKSGKGGGSGGNEELKKMKEFNRAFEKARTEIADPAKAAQLKATNEESFNEKQQWLKDNQDQYDRNIKALGKGGGAGAPAPAGGDSGAAPDNAPFNVDDFIKGALGQ